MKDREIEACLQDDLARRVAQDIATVYGHGADALDDGVNLMLPLQTVVGEMIARLRCAGISEGALQIALLDDPQRTREYYAMLKQLRDQHEQETDPEKRQDLYIQIRQHQVTLNLRYGKFGK
jgi:hypothetical protein